MFNDHRRWGGGGGGAAAGRMSPRKPQHRRDSRAPSPLLPRIGSRGGPGAEDAAAGGRGVIARLEGRMAMLEERVSNVDRENSFLRHQLETLGTSLNKQVDDGNRQMLKELQSQFAAQVETSAMARSSGFAATEVLKRVAHVEKAVQRDNAALLQLREQLRVELAQGMHKGSSASSSAVSQAAASAATCVKIAAEAQDMLAELRASLRAKDEEDLVSRDKTRRQLKVLAEEIQRVTVDITFLSGKVGSNEEALAGGGGKRGAAGEGEEGGEMIMHMAALNKHVGERISALEEDIDARFKLAEGGGDTARQITELAAALNSMTDDLAREREARRKQVEEQAQTVARLQQQVEAERENVREALAQQHSRMGDRLGSLVNDVGKSLSSQREASRRRLQSAQEAQMARMDVEGKAFDTIAARFTALEERLASETASREETALLTAKTTAEVLGELAKKVQEEASLRQQQMDRVLSEMRGLGEANATAVKALSEAAGRDRDQLAKLVGAEIDSRIERDAKTVAELNRYVRGLSDSVKKVKDTTVAELAEVRGLIEAVQVDVLKSLRASSQHLEREAAKNGAASEERDHELRRDFEALRDSLSARFREQQKDMDDSMDSFTQQVTSSFEGLQAGIKKATDAEWKSRDEQRRELEATIERNAAASADAITALQTVAAEDKDALVQSLQELDERLSGRMSTVQGAFADQFGRLETDLVAAMERLRAMVDRGNELHTSTIKRLSESTDARFAIVQDNQLQFHKAIQAGNDRVVENFNAEHTKIVEMHTVLQEEMDRLASSVNDSLVELQLKAFLGRVISGIEMQDVAERTAVAQTRHVVRDTAPRLASVRADMEELQQRVVKQNEATVAAIGSTDRKAEASLADLQQRLATMFANFENDVEERRAAMDARVAEMEAKVGAVSSSVEDTVREAVPHDKVSALESAVGANRGRAEDLEARVEELSRALREREAAHDAAWEQAVSLAEAFDAGAPPPAATAAPPRPSSSRSSRRSRREGQRTHSRQSDARARPASGMAGADSGAQRSASRASGDGGARHSSSVARGGGDRRGSGDALHGDGSSAAVGTGAGGAVGYGARGAAGAAPSAHGSGAAGAGSGGGRGGTSREVRRTPSRGSGSGTRTVPQTPDSQGSALEYRPGPIVPHSVFDER